MAFAGIAKYFTKALDITSTATGAGADVLYTCPANFVSLVRFLHVSNGTANNKTYSVQYYNSADSTYKYVVDEHSLSANALEEIIEGGGYIALQPGDKLVCYAEASSDFHIVASGEEHYQPTG